MTKNVSELRRIAFPSPQVGYVTNFYGKVFRTDDAGITWRALSVRDTQWPFDTLSFVNPRTGIIGSRHSLLVTTDGGQHWAPVSRSAIAHADGQFFACSDELDPIHRFLSASKDEVFVDLIRVVALSESDWYASGVGGLLLYTGNSGRDWHSVQTGSSIGVYSLCFAGSHGYGVGERGTVILVDRHAPATASLIDLPSMILDGVMIAAPALDDVAIADDGVACIVGEEGAIFRTEDRGATWAHLPVATRNWLRRVAFFDPSAGLILGDDSTLLQVERDGSSWKLRQVPNSWGMRDLAVTSDSVAYGIGSDRTILRTTDHGRTFQVISRIL